MRILHTESSPNFGGQELQIIEEMQWFRQRGHEIWLAAREGSGIHKLALERKLSVIPTGFRGAINLGVIASLWRECRRLKIELIVAHGSRDITCAWPVARLLGLPLIRYQHICKRLKDGVFDKLLWRRANDRIVVVSGSIKNRLLEQQLAPAEKIQIIGGYVDRTEFHPQISPKDVRAKHQIPADATLITIVGMFRRDKGQHLLVEASTEILRQHPNCWFMFVGGPLKPGYLEEVQAKVQKLPHAGRFVFTGFQSDIPAYMAASDVICLTSEIEAHSKVILQSLAMGKIVVASKVGGTPELVRHGENGLLYERNAGALAAAVDTALAGDRQQIIANALADAERLDINRVMAENEKLYAALTA